MRTATALLAAAMFAAAQGQGDRIPAARLRRASKLFSGTASKEKKRSRKAQRNARKKNRKK